MNQEQFYLLLFLLALLVAGLLPAESNDGLAFAAVSGVTPDLTRYQHPVEPAKVVIVPAMTFPAVFPPYTVALPV